nr:ferric siderophore transport system periplasmic binding protein TonB [uncultured bacterium]
MFDRLVLSTKDQRKGRTGKFLFVTSLFYSLALASALIVSVVAASPMLDETGNVLDALPAIPLASLPPAGPRAKGPEPKNPSAQPDIYKVKDLETITRGPSTNEPPRSITKIPSTDIEGTGIGSGGPGGPGVIGGTSPAGSDIGLPTDGREIPPPPPPPVQKPVEKPQPAVDKQPLRVSSRVLTGAALERKTPVYPPLAKQVRLEGSVTVEVVISLDGRVEAARALGGHPLLTTAAVEAAKGWRFNPTLLNGVPVRVTGLITFNFNLN